MSEKVPPSFLSSTLSPTQLSGTSGTPFPSSIPFCGHTPAPNELLVVKSSGCPMAGSQGRDKSLQACIQLLCLFHKLSDVPFCSVCQRESSDLRQRLQNRTETMCKHMRKMCESGKSPLPVMRDRFIRILAGIMRNVRRIQILKNQRTANVLHVSS